MGQPKFSQVGQTAASFVLIQVRSRCLDEYRFHLNRQDNSDGLLWSWRTIPAFWIFIESISPSLLPTSQSHLLIPQPNPTPSPPTNPTHNHGLHPPLQTQRHRSLQTHCTLSPFPNQHPPANSPSQVHRHPPPDPPQRPRLRPLPRPLPLDPPLHHPLSRNLPRPRRRTSCTPSPPPSPPPPKTNPPQGNGLAVGYCIGTPNVYTLHTNYTSYTTNILTPSIPAPKNTSLLEPFQLPDGTVNAAHLIQKAWNPTWLITEDADALGGKYKGMMHVDILEGWQGKGFGRGLVEGFLGLVKGSGEDFGKGVYLGVSPENLKVVGFYERLGWRVWEREDGAEGVTMVFDL